MRFLATVVQVQGHWWTEHCGSTYVESLWLAGVQVCLGRQHHDSAQCCDRRCSSSFAWQVWPKDANGEGWANPYIVNSALQRLIKPFMVYRLNHFMSGGVLRYHLCTLRSCVASGVLRYSWHHVSSKDWGTFLNRLVLRYHPSNLIIWLYPKRCDPLLE